MTNDIFLTDAIGQQHQPVAAAQARIVSLVPSITELICDLGLASSLVGRTGFCIHPADVVQAIPKIGGTKDVNIEKIRRLAPTHLIVNIDENEKPTVDLLAEFIPHVIVTHPNTPRDNLALYRLLGGIFQADAAAEQLCTRLKMRMRIWDCPSLHNVFCTVSGKTRG
jgi:ABC-type Fe3+-hydroxamate transport system substrate-binding protein